MLGEVEFKGARGGGPRGAAAGGTADDRGDKMVACVTRCQYLFAKHPAKQNIKD